MVWYITIYYIVQYIHKSMCRTGESVVCSVNCNNIQPVEKSGPEVQQQFSNNAITQLCLNIWCIKKMSHISSTKASSAGCQFTPSQQTKVIYILYVLHWLHKLGPAEAQKHSYRLLAFSELSYRKCQMCKGLHTLIKGHRNIL